MSGLVTFEGEPVTAGTVTFYSTRRNGGGLIQPDGTFKVNGEGLLPDSYLVAITPPDPAFGPSMSGAPSPPRPEHPEIPLKYRTPVQSGFQAEVIRQENYFVFAMLRDDEPPPPDESSAGSDKEAPPPPRSQRKAEQISPGP